MSTARVFTGGVPTAPDVKRLIEKFGSPEPETVIGYDAIATVIGAAYGSHRFTSVMTAWKATLLREHNVELGHIDGEAVVALTNEQRTEAAQKRFRQGGRQIGRSHRRALMIRAEECDPITRHKLEHIRRVTGIATQAVAEQSRDLANALKAPEQLPRIAGGETK